MFIHSRSLLTTQRKALSWAWEGRGMSLPLRRPHLAGKPGSYKMAQDSAVVFFYMRVPSTQLVLSVPSPVSLWSLSSFHEGQLELIFFLRP